jgi:hypothetical protein
MKCFKARKAVLASLLFFGVVSTLSGCGRWNKPAATPSSTTTVSSTVPVNGASAVATGNKLTVTFSEPMDPASINKDSFILRQGGAVVAGTVSYFGVTAVFTPPAGGLAPGTLYDATVTTGARDLAGAALANDYHWSFTTGSAVDGTRPTVSATVPAPGAIGVATGSRLSATFSEAMDPETINAASFTLKQGATVVPGSVSYSGVTALFTPTSALSATLPYSATITTLAKDLGGNALAVDFVWSFTSGVAADTAAPTVSSTVPVQSATGVAIGSKLTATFSEAMNPLTISTTTFTLKQGTTTVAGTVNYQGANVDFTPAVNLTPGTLYSATITTGAQDLAGNGLASNHVWSFTTSSASDSIRPTVSSTAPAAGGAGIITNTKLTATFSEPMDPLTLTAATFTLSQGATVVPGTVTASGQTAVFTPATSLTVGLSYSATITTGARDLGGNGLANNFTWSFTPSAAADLINPTLTLTVPASAATGAGVNQAVSVTFSEDMDPATLTTANFTLKKGLVSIVGTVSYDTASRIATFTPLNPLALNTTYTALIAAGASDLAGNPLASSLPPNPWNFTTAATAAALPAAVTVNLRSIAQFGAVGGKGITSSGNTLITGDVATTSASTLVVGLTDGNGSGNAYSPAGNPGIVNGKIYTAPPAPGDAISMAVATQAQTDAQIAFDATSPASLPGGIAQTPELGGLTLPPGIYSSGTSFNMTNVDLTLDAQGDPNAVWVFQSSSTLTVGTNVKVILIKGALAKNVYWHVSSAATLKAGSQMKGTILAFSGVSLGTGARLDGRAISLVGGPVTMLGNIINLP